ncbi:NTP transferase domain-containing protein [Halobellus litoreus]|uniref:NTP transferase domain-containing protein n=1 Tax=Halobellus litoreus TaxID=755310 RepID=A0ABD6DR44_9EURY|nr:NTP transferase domain-containing protein [Halobellus litoreus]
MCGGRGTRLRDGAETEQVCDVEKPLVEVGDQPMLDRIVDALRASRIGGPEASDAGTIHAVVSPHAPETAERARALSLSVVETPGQGYVSDLATALDEVGRPALTVPADLPLLASEHVDDAIERARSGGRSSELGATSLTVCVPAALKRRLGASVDTSFERDGRAVAPTGLNVVAGDDDTVALTYDARLAVNVNRPADRELAEALCG